MIVIRKILILICFFIFETCAYAQDFDSVLDSLIENYGVFEDENGVVYANTINFSTDESFIAVYISDNSVHCDIYDDYDGIQCTDRFTLDNTSDFFIYTASDMSYDYIGIKMNNSDTLYTIKDDCFYLAKNPTLISKTKIISCKNSKITSHCTKRSLYNFRNTLKKNKFSQYSMLNIVNIISDAEKQSLLSFIRACADIMEFDINNYDYDKLMQYLLSSNQNFRILTDINSTLTKNDEDLFIINAGYIDYILKTYFDITPVHPAVNSLINCGYCVDNGYYYYKNIFNTFYATDVIDISAIYKLNDNTYYTIFTDIYRQGDKTFPEYSYAVIRKNDNGIYNLLKLGMGKQFPDEYELKKFNHNPTNYVWNNKVKKNSPSLLYTLLLVVTSFGAVSIICGIILIIQYIRCK